MVAILLAATITFGGCNITMSDNELDMKGDCRGVTLAGGRLSVPLPGTPQSPLQGAYQCGMTLCQTGPTYFQGGGTTFN
jgi:hypothetical protein